MSRVREHLEPVETDFLFFTQTVCPYCTREERTLDAHGLYYATTRTHRRERESPPSRWQASEKNLPYILNKEQIS